MKGFKGILYVSLSAIGFGIMPFLAKVAYAQGLTSYNLLFLRFLAASLLLIFYVVRKKITIKLSIKEYIYISLLSLVGYTSSAFCLFTSYKYISIGLAGLIFFVYPVMVAILSFIIYKEKITKKTFISLLLSVLGLYFLIAPSYYGINSKGLIFCFMASFFYSIYVLGTCNKTIRRINGYVLTLYISIIATILMFFVVLYKGEMFFQLNFNSFVSIILIAFISTIVALTTFIEGAKIIGPTKAAIISNIEPIVSLFLGISILGEVLTITVFLGGVLILLATVVLCLKS